jgi:hypothetical protein
VAPGANDPQTVSKEPVAANRSNPYDRPDPENRKNPQVGRAGAPIQEE